MKLRPCLQTKHPLGEHATQHPWRRGSQTLLSLRSRTPFGSVAARLPGSLRCLCGLALALAVLLLPGHIGVAQAAPLSQPGSGGLILDATSFGESGAQLDAVAASPRGLAFAQGQAAPAQTYIVQPGDTLSTIAEQLEVDPATLAAENGLSDPDQVPVGQVLHTGSQQPAPLLRLPAGGPWERLQFYPWPPTQGQTMAVWLRTTAPVSLTASFGGQALPVIAEGQRAWVLVGVPPLMEPGTHPLILSTGAVSFTVPVPVQAGVFPSDEVPPEVSDPILQEAEKVNAETARLTALFAGVSQLPWNPHSRFRSPLVGDFMHTSPFGSRRTYGSSGELSFHAGEDFAANPGTPVLAPASGNVVLAEPLFVRGNAVVLDHGHGVFTGYWHLSVIDVKPGDQVVAGQKLGEVGSTGMSTGAHLHWELRIAGVPVDPLPWLNP